MKKATIYLTSMLFTLYVLSACATNKMATSNISNEEKTEQNRTTARNIVDVENKSAGTISWMEILQRTPGVSVKGSDRELSIQIRGNKSMTTTFEPLFVVDGIIMGNGFHNISQIDPIMVKRVEVLKDGASSAAYGSRGAGGIVLVTMK